MAIYGRYGRILTDEEKAERDKRRKLEEEARLREQEADDFEDFLLPPRPDSQLQVD